MEYSSKDVAFILVNGYDLRAYSGELSDDIEAMTDERTPLGVAWPQHAYVGVRKAELTQSGWFDDAANASNDALNGNEGTSRVLCYGIEGNTAGRRFIGFSGALQVNYKRILERNKIHRASAKYMGDGQVDQDGVILQPLAAATATYHTELAPVDHGAATTAGGAGYVQVVAFTGFTSVVVKVRHAALTTFADLVTFATVTGRTAQRLTVAGTVERNLAVSVAVTGTGSLTLMVGFKRF